MASTSVVVTIGVDERQRGLIEKYLENAQVTYLADLNAKERAAALRNAQVVFSWNLPRELDEDELGLLKNAELIQLVSAGVDHLPFEKLANGPIIASNAGAFAEPMAEHVLGMTLALAKRLCPEHNKLKQGNFDQFTNNRFLKGKVCGILGYGGIGQATAKLMRALGMRIFAVNRSAETGQDVDFIGTLQDLEHVLNASDLVVISLPLNNVTRGLIGERELGWMKQDAILVNVARGEIIQEGPFYQHLKSHPEFLAGIDAWWVEPFRQGEFRLNYPFLDLPNVLGSPHNSAVVPETMLQGASHALENVRRYLNGEPVQGVIRRDEYTSVGL
jgi:phosphoglycerate dehydrogenase-like enzyme